MPDGPRRRGVSLQEQVYRHLDEQLADAGSGARLPTEAELVAQFAVSRVTIRAALARLAQEGRIERTRGRGTVAKARPAAPRLSLSDVLDDMDHVARTTAVRLLVFDDRPAPADVAALLGLPVGAPCQHAIRLRLAGAAALLHLTSYIPAAIGRLWTEAELARLPLQSLLRRHPHPAVGGQQVVSAAQAGPAVADRLGVGVGTALLRVQRVTQAEDGSPIGYLDILGPAASFELRMSLRIN